MTPKAISDVNRSERIPEMELTMTDIANLDQTSTIFAIANLQAEVARLRVDAERYRWLRDVGDHTFRPLSRRSEIGAASVDAAIDAALAATAPMRAEGT